MSLNSQYGDILEIDRVTKKAKYLCQHQSIQPLSDVICYVPGKYNDREDNLAQGILILDVPGHEDKWTREYNEPKYQVWLIYDNIDNYWRNPQSTWEIRSCDLYDEIPRLQVA